jgi:hypothetical protein
MEPCDKLTLHSRPHWHHDATTVNETATTVWHHRRTQSTQGAFQALRPSGGEPGERWGAFDDRD